MSVDGSPFEFYKFKKTAPYDFWRCYSCGKLFTYEQEQERIRQMDVEPGARMCDCGSMRYRATKPGRSPRHRWSPFRLLTKKKLLYGNEWLDSIVLTYVVKLILARGVSPWCEDHYPKALPYIEKLVRPNV